MFPGLVNCTTIDWFTEWPADALYEVASRQLASESLGSADVQQAICKVSCLLTVWGHCKMHIFRE
jgi:dynein heavy chain